jgi:threonine/homoserine/homoserine lactone efflux protein
MYPFIEGILLGFTLATLFGFGPALFALLQTTIHRGFLSGFILAIGIFLSDLVLVGLCFMGAIQIINKPENKLAFGIISGIILLIFGIVTYTRKACINNKEEKVDEKKPGPFTFILKGFFMNIANPFVWIFWMSVVVGITANYEADKSAIIAFFSGTLLTVLSTDVLKCFASYKIKKFITPNVIQYINHVAGIGLVGFGLFLIAKAIFHF